LINEVEDIMTLFYKLTSDTAAELIAAELPKSSWKLWTWITTLNPFGDRQVQITCERAKEAIGISKTSFYRALAQLKDKGLVVLSHLSGFCVSPKNGTRVPDLELDSQNWQLDSQNWDATLYIDLQTKQTLSDLTEAEKKNERPPEEDEKTVEQETQGQNAVSQDNLALATVNQTSTVKPTKPLKEKSSAARTKKGTNEFDWLPEGPWSIDGKLDPNFRDWLAKEWQAAYGGTIHQKRADVLRHFRKDPANLAIRWEQYRSEFVDRVQNTQILLSKGIQIKQETQDKLITNQRALTAEFPAEMNPMVSDQPDCITEASEAIAYLSEASTTVPALPVPEEITEPDSQSVVEVEDTAPALVEQPEATAPETQTVTPQNPVEANQTAPNSQPPTPNSQPSAPNSQPPAPRPQQKNTEVVETADGRRLPVFRAQDLPDEDRDPAKLRAMVNAFLKGFGGPSSRNAPKKPDPQPLTELEKLNSWLHDPILRESTIAQVNRSESYKYCPLADEIIYCEEF
jgi:hypothetical protein